MDTEKKKKGWRALVIGLVLLVLLAGAYLIFATGRIPFLPGRQTIADDNPVIMLDILTPGMAENFLVGQPIQVSVQAWSLAPLDHIELIVDGQVVSRQDARPWSRRRKSWAAC